MGAEQGLAWVLVPVLAMEQVPEPGQELAKGQEPVLDHNPVQEQQPVLLPQRRKPPNLPRHQYLFQFPFRPRQPIRCSGLQLNFRRKKISISQR